MAKYGLVRDGVLVEIAKTPPIIGSIYIPSAAREALQIGKVIAVRGMKGVSVGDHIVYKNYCGTPMPGGDQILLKPEDVEGKIQISEVENEAD